jgi:YbbR domain-containing protein
VQIIRKNFGLKLLSVALAIVGWAYFRFATNPVIAARFDQQLSVPIVAANLPVGYIVHFTDKEAVVTIATKRGEAPTKPDEIKAVLDLSNKAAGVYNVPVQLVAPNIAVQSLSPASVTLTVEKIETRALPIILHYVGQEQNGVVVGAASTMPSTVTLHGPTSLLSQVSAVRVDVPLPPTPKAFDEMARPTPVDSLNQEVDGIESAPNLIRVQIHFVPGTGDTSKK